MRADTEAVLELTASRLSQGRAQASRLNAQIRNLQSQLDGVLAQIEQDEAAVDRISGILARSHNEA